MLMESSGKFNIFKKLPNFSEVAITFYSNDCQDPSITISLPLITAILVCMSLWF